MLDLSSARTVRSCALFLLAALLAGACQGIPGPSPAFGNRTESLGPQRLDEVRPGDIAVLPVVNQTPVEDLAVETFRRAFQAGLVARLYSPLDLAYVDEASVDGHWQESSFPGSPPPDAVLVVAVNHWSTSDVVGQGLLEVGAELRLFAGGSAEGTPLWGAQVDRKVRVATGNPPYGPLEELVGQGIVEYARLALEVLPARDPLAVPRESSAGR
ncbi:MAG: hypothetical protein AB1726_04975 [Planctomycetota bacterium]